LKAFEDQFPWTSKNFAAFPMKNQRQDIWQQRQGGQTPIEWIPAGERKRQE
jgi:hypothetical protein